MATIKRNTRRKKPLSSKTTPPPKGILENFISYFFSKEKKDIYKYILNRLLYLVGVLIMGFFIQSGVNLVMDHVFDGAYHMGLFEAAILWVCVY